MSIEPIAMGEIQPEATLEDCEQALHAVERNAALQQGVILRHVRDHRLYESAGFRSFEECVEQRFGYQRTWAYQRIDLADTVQKMSAIADAPVITTESHARAIKPILRDHGPEVAADVLPARTDRPDAVRAMLEERDDIAAVFLEPTGASWGRVKSFIRC